MALNAVLQPATVKATWGGQPFGNCFALGGAAAQSAPLSLFALALIVVIEEDRPAAGRFFNGYGLNLGP